MRFAQMLANGGELDGVRILSHKTLECIQPPRPTLVVIAMGTRGTKAVVTFQGTQSTEAVVTLSFAFAF